MDTMKISSAKSRIYCIVPLCKQNKINHPQARAKRECKAPGRQNSGAGEFKDGRVQ